MYETQFSGAGIPIEHSLHNPLTPKQREEQECRARTSFRITSSSLPSIKNSPFSKTNKSRWLSIFENNKRSNKREVFVENKSSRRILVTSHIEMVIAIR